MSDKYKKVLVMGNGFDLYHKLPTTYKDFMDVINRLLELDYQKKNYYFLAYIFGDRKNDLYENNINIRKCYDTYRSKIKNTDLDFDNIKLMIKIAKRNSWFQYFNCCMRDNSMGWIDFEQEIRKVLDAFRSLFEKTKIEDENIKDEGIILNINELTISERIIISEFSFFKKNKSPVTSFINNKDVYIDADYCINKNTTLNQQLVDINRTKITKYLSDQLNEFSQLFELYIIEFINKVSVDGSIKHSMFEDVDAVITFNYTDTYKNIYNNLNDDFIEYIHGHAGDGNIVFGINSDKYDELETIDTDFIFFKKEYKRILNGNLFFYKRLLKNFNYINFIFFGHSLDITDKDILVDLVENYNDSKCTIYHYDDIAKENYVKNLFKLFGKTKIEELLEENRLEFKPIP